MPFQSAPVWHPALPFSGIGERNQRRALQSLPGQRQKRSPHARGAPSGETLVTPPQATRDSPTDRNFDVAVLLLVPHAPRSTPPITDQPVPNDSQVASPYLNVIARRPPGIRIAGRQLAPARRQGGWGDRCLPARPSDLQPVIRRTRSETCEPAHPRSESRRCNTRERASAGCTSNAGPATTAPPVPSTG